MRKTALVVLAGAGLCGADPALARGPAVSGIVAPADSAVTAADNPAGLTRLQQSELVGEATGLALHSTDDSSASVLGSVRGPRSVDSDNVIGIPAVYYARPWDDRLAFGVALFVPAGVGSDPGDATIGRYLLEKWSLTYVSLAPAAGYRLNDRLSLGLAVNFIYASYEYKTAVFNGPALPDGTMKLNDWDFSVGYRLGLLYELTSATRFGLVYRSSTTSNFSSTANLSGLTPQRQAILNAVGVRNRPVSLETKFPQALVAGAYHQFSNGVSATLDAAWVDFSQFGLTQATVGSFSIDTSDGKFKNIWAGSAGLNWPLGGNWTAQLGMAYASSGVDDANRTFALRLDRVWGLGAGAEYRWTKDKIVSGYLNYFDLGKAPVSVGVPGVGSLSAQYSTNYAIGLKISFRWVWPDAAR